MMQSGYEAQWGSSGRDDLGVIKTLGANAVRLYHSFGVEYNHDHGKFLDRAEELGLHVMVAMHTQVPCPNFDCSASVKSFITSGLAQGFLKNKTWHPAISTIVLLDQPDALSFGGDPEPPTCAKGKEPECRLKASLSAMDGFLQAEKAAGLNVTHSNVNFTITWGPQYGDSIDTSFPKGTLYYGFHDMNHGVHDPDIVDYSPKTSSDDWSNAYNNRYVHSLVAVQPWAIMKAQVLAAYDQFLPTPMFIAEYRANNMGGPGVESDLKAMDEEAKKGGPFLGANLYQFQKAYQNAKGMPQCGIFDLGNKSTGSVNVCQDDVRTHRPACHNWDVYCLNPNTQGRRAQAMVSAWGGKIEEHAMCPGVLNADQIII